MNTEVLGVRERLEYSTHEVIIELDLADVKEGVTVFEDYVAYRSGSNVRFYDRMCDHNGGNLISTPENSALLRCPLHDWKFDPAAGRYTNVNYVKKPLDFDCANGKYLVRNDKRALDWQTTPSEGEVTLTFLNHACFIVNIADKISFATDPWVLGSAFCDGWWLSEASPCDAIERLAACDFIYISHNHPDHLHPETLKKLPLDTRFLVPNFKNQSVSRYLDSLGFDVLHSCDFGDVYDFNISGFKFAMLKSGDFRDDSGIVFSYGDFLAVMTVDCNGLNNYCLPKNITLLATSFAGGASGFPLCFNNYEEEEKRRIISRNRSAMRYSVDKYLEATNAKFYVPYAGYFKEDFDRDGYVANRNKKNTPADMGRHVENKGVSYINPVETRTMTFSGDELVDTGTIPLETSEIDHSAWYRDSAQRFGDVSDQDIYTYFQGATFTDSLVLYINLCDENFNSLRQIYAVDFRKQPITVTRIPQRPTLEEISQDDGINRIILDIRAPAFGRIIREFLPWEDFMIGFQARVERWPNVYNSRMWYYFTNEYIVDYARKASFDCSQACERLKQELR